MKITKIQHDFRRFIGFFSVTVFLFLGITSCASQNIASHSPPRLTQRASTGRPIAIQDSSEHFNFDPLFYPYYARLNPEYKSAYRQIYDALIHKRSKVVFDGSYDTEMLNHVVFSVNEDHPEIFWFEGNARSTQTLRNNVLIQTQIDFSYNKLTSNKNAQKFEAAILEILQEAQKLPTKLKQELYVYDIFRQRIEYAANSLDQNAYSALVDRKTVCAGYARAFQVIMRRLGIPAYTLSGMIPNNGTGHAWNLVYINGQYYNVDATGQRQQNTTPMDDALKTHGISTLPTYDRFNISDATMRVHAMRSPGVYTDSCKLPKAPSDMNLSSLLSAESIHKRFSQKLPSLLPAILTSLDDYYRYLCPYLVEHPNSRQAYFFLVKGNHARLEIAKSAMGFFRSQCSPYVQSSNAAIYERKQKSSTSYHSQILGDLYLVFEESSW